MAEDKSNRELPRVIKQKETEKTERNRQMSTQIFLGPPPQHIEAWIKANFKPTVNPLSFLEYSGTTITGLKKDPNLN